ncbi:hypothetical protein [Helicobacter anatolicus]|uniref:hypothetical protein n=1 Tax=Helicobacter anatolicus TaxID=2905874 RepID=UPI001E3521E3|nr:hypothetical protein [Helicobacter anatolicus]MCE3037979.1 hypothetical protein [Helicobacter anatolicus]
MSFHVICKQILFLLLLFMFFGCSGGTLKKFNEAYYGGDASGAYGIAKNRVEENIDSSQGEVKQDADNLLWQVQAGVSGFYLNEKDASRYLNLADSLMQENIKSFIKNFFQTTASILTSDSILPYPIYLYEASMVNYYLALDAMGNGKQNDARIFFNQALERQNDAKDYYAKELQEREEKLLDMQKISEETPKDEQYLAVGISLAKSKDINLSLVQENFINPMIVYMKFLFEMIQGNFAGIHSLGNDFLALIPKEDKNIFTARKQGDTKRYTWMIIEDGRSAFKDSIAFSIPLPMDPTAFLNFGGMAAAILAFQDKKSAETIGIAAAALSGGVLLNYAEPVLLDGVDFSQIYEVDSIRATKFFDMQALIETEFNKRMPGVRIRAIARSVPPAITSYLVEQGGKQAGYKGLGFLLSLLHRAVISADTRMITALPNAFYIMRFENFDGEKELVIDGKNRIKFSLNNQEEDHIIYVRNLGHEVFMRILN